MDWIALYALSLFAIFTAFRRNMEAAEPMRPPYTLNHTLQAYHDHYQSVSTHKAKDSEAVEWSIYLETLNALNTEGNENRQANEMKLENSMALLWNRYEPPKKARQ